MKQNQLVSYLQIVPKAELHVHFEGSMQPETLLYLAQKNSIKLPVNSIEGLREWFIFDGFSHFVTVYHTITACLQKIEDYEYATYKFGEFLDLQNIKYAEVTFTPGNHYRRGIAFETFFEGLTKGRERLIKDKGILINWIFDIERNSDERNKYANYVVDVAIEGKNDGVVGLGLGGKEEGFPAKLFIPYFTRAKKAGLHSVPHAGEFTNSKNIWDSVNLLGAERIGHGIMAAKDKKLIKTLIKRNIPLEINPISNIRLGIFKDIHQHPVQLLHESGVPLVIGSDDPSLFSNSLIADFTLLSENSYFNLNVLQNLISNSISFSFMNKHQKHKMLLEVIKTTNLFINS